MDFNDKIWGPYHIQDEIGRGGTAVVYRAIDTRTGQAVALKILPPLIANQETFLKRFIKEGKNAIRLRHESIVPTYAAGEIDGIYYMAMQLVTGGTLAEVSSARGQLFSIDESINILSQIAAALDFAHSEGILHRDVKPSNILMAEDGRVLLTDFGTAKQMFGEDTVMTAPSQRIGTPSFMSPEQISGDTTIDYRSDVYSLGVLAYKLFTGRLPFTSSSQAELLHKIIYETPLSPHVLNPELPSNVVDNLKRVLAKEPAQRHESAGQFVAALVAGQMWASRLMANDSAVTLPGATPRKNLKRVQRGLQMLNAAVRPVLIILVLLALFLMPSYKSPKLSFPQIQTNAINQIDALSARLLAFFDSPQAKVFWATYGDPMITAIHVDDQLGENIRKKAQNIGYNIVSFNQPNGWVQRTWRYWNRVTLSDLLN